ncbi:MAG: hypothetical protein ACLU6Y_00265 [Ruminococcus sp.]
MKILERCLYQRRTERWKSSEKNHDDLTPKAGAGSRSSDHPSGIEHVPSFISHGEHVPGTREVKGGLSWTIRTMEKEAKRILDDLKDRYRSEIRPSVICRYPKQQMVEIAKALSIECKDPDHGRTYIHL